MVMYMLTVFLLLISVCSCISVQVPTEDTKLRYSTKVELTGTGCSCIKASYECGCCAHLDMPKIKLDNTGCVNLTYLPDQYGISLTFSLDGKIFFNETISARNPPPVCFGLPYLEKEASICVDFYDLDISKKSFSGCVKIEGRLLHVVVEEIKLGCFNIPLARYDSSLTSQKIWLNKMNGASKQKRLDMFKFYFLKHGSH